MFNINYTKMKKLILIFLLLFAVSSQAQIDTATWSLQRDGLGHYSILTNRITVAGVTAGTIRAPLVMSMAQIDTSKFQLIRDGYGNYSVAINKASLYGIDSGKIRVGISYGLGTVRLDEANTWTAPQTFDSLISTNVLIKKALNPVQVVFQSLGQTQKVSMGMIGTPEANISLNMDYSRRYHRYYDSTKSALWWSLSNGGIFLQYMPSGYVNDTVGGQSPWYRSGGKITFQTDTAGHTKINGVLVLSPSDKGQITNFDTTILINAGTSKTAKGLYYISRPIQTTGKIYGIYSSIGSLTDDTSYAYYSYIGGAGTGKKWNLYTDGGENLFKSKSYFETSPLSTSYHASTVVGIKANGRAVLNMITPNANDSYVMFGNANGNNRGWVAYTNTTEIISLYGTNGILMENDMTLGASIVGSARVRGSDAFTGNETLDSVVVASAISTDIYIVTPTGATAEPEQLTVIAGTGYFLVRRPIGTTSGLTYNWFRIK